MIFSLAVASANRAQATGFINGYVRLLQQVASARTSMASSRAFKKDAILFIGGTVSVGKAKTQRSPVQKLLETILQTLADELTGCAASTGIRSLLAHAMADITHTCEKITDIIALINNIAFQTKILALNAAVEAARIGERGRGFAVVATVVRVLAQRLTGAATEVASLIGTSVVQANRQLAHIISSAKSEQSASIAQVSDAVGQLDQVQPLALSMQA